MSINIHIKKKDLWLLAAIMVFLVGVAYVIAYGGNQPSVHGHSAGEIEGVGGLGAYGMAYRLSHYPSPIANQWFDVPLEANSNLVDVAHSTTVNPERVTVNVAGTYLIHYNIFIDGTKFVTAVARARLYKNGVSEIPGSHGSTSTITTDVGESIGTQVITSLSANDYITIQVYVDSTIRDASNATLTAVRIGP